jgi:hypothetical protein
MTVIPHPLVPFQKACGHYNRDAFKREGYYAIITHMRKASEFQPYTELPLEESDGIVADVPAMPLDAEGAPDIVEWRGCYQATREAQAGADYRRIRIVREIMIADSRLEPDA